VVRGTCCGVEMNAVGLSAFLPTFGLSCTVFFSISKHFLATFLTTLSGNFFDNFLAILPVS
jgi:hypothetical protein